MLSKMNDLLSLFLLRSTIAKVNTNTTATATARDNSPPQQQQHSQQLVVDTSSSWGYLSLRDLYQLKCVSKATYESLELVEYNRCRDGKDYLVPFPGYPGVLSTPSDVKFGAGLFPHQLSSLRAMHRAENRNTHFGALRGGILGDAPGLGKTITMLSLIANTAGCKPQTPKEFYDDASIAEHWKLMRTNPVFRMEILKALQPFRNNGYILQNSYDEMAKYVSPPYTDDRFPTLGSFEQYVHTTMRNRATQAQLDLFRRNVMAFKAGLDKRNRRFFNNDKGKRMLFERNLIPCSSTVVIVPDALLEHWADQIRRHVNLGVFVDPNYFDRNKYTNFHSYNGNGNGEGAGGGVRTEGRPKNGVVYIDGVGDLSTARFPLNHQQIPLPSSYDLMSYTIVVVPFSRIRQHYVAMQKRRREEETMATYRASEDASAHYNSPLLQLRWFRIVVDEGHELGEHAAGSDVTKFINQMGAERRWVMSGTPTTGDEDSPKFTAKGLDQLQRLLLFLRHETYGTTMSQFDGKNTSSWSDTALREGNKWTAKSAWDKLVKKPFLNKQEDGRKELYRVLDEVMIMHKKEDLSLPKPIFKQSQIDILVPPNIQSAIIDIVHSTDESDTITDALHKIGIANHEQRLRPALTEGGSILFDALIDEYLRTDSFQALVDEGQANFIIDVIRKEQLALEERGGAIMGTGNAPITAATQLEFCSKNWVDRRPFKAVVYSNSHKYLLSVAEYLYAAFDNENIAEMIEGKIEQMSYELGRFRHNFKEGKDCPICGGWNEFTGKKLASCRNRLVEVFYDGKTFLIEPERIKRAVGPAEFRSLGDRMQKIMYGSPVEMDRLDGAPLSKYNVSHLHWRVGDVLCIDTRDPHPLLRKRWSEEQWAKYGSVRCMELAAEYAFEGQDNYFGPLPVDESEVIVRLTKWQPCGRFHSRPRWDARRCKNIGWYTGPNLQDVEMREQREDTFLLLLDARLSHGLDLSFVTHMFLLEPIDDAALLEQVTSRAHRLGCTGPVTIDTLNVWHEIDSTTKGVAKKLSSSVQDETKKRTSTSVCEHCYRSFETLELAEAHELTCERNPDGNAKVDPFHLSSVYRDIRPPAPMLVGGPSADGDEGVIQHDVV